MSFMQFRTDVKRAVNRRRMYARINALPQSTVRDELLAIARRHEDGNLRMHRHVRFPSRRPPDRFRFRRADGP